MLAAVACGAGNLFEVFAPGHYALQPNFAIFFFAAALLPPWASAIVAAIAFLPGLVAGRSEWFKTAFNAGNYALAGLAVHGVLASPLAGTVDGTHGGIHHLVLLVAAAAAFAVVNHLLLVLIASFAGGERVRRNLHQIADGLPLDVALGLTGATLVVLWQEPALVALAAGPLALVYRALALPQLEHQARTDAKTGLFNSQHFTERLEEELAHAQRTGGRLAVVLVDLDHLREINNRLGHLAGDCVIRGVADALQDVTGETGLASRFGGEEYCLLLPDASFQEAGELAERLRRRVAATHFRLDDEADDSPIRVTLSAGVASYPEHAETAFELLKAADVAVYEAKSAGRDRVRIALAPEARAALELRSRPVAPPLAAVPAPTAPDAPVPGVAPDPVLRTEREAPVHEAPAPTPPARRLVRPYAAAVAGIAAVVGVWSSGGGIHAPAALAALLVAAVVALDLTDLDVFGRGRLSPGAVPSVALACAMGPFGPILAEAAVTALRLARREGVTRSAFNFGALSLSGVAAAAVFALAPDAHGAGTVALATLASIAYYAVNSSLVAVVWALDESLSPTAAWRHRFAWAAPHHLVFGAAAGLLLIAYDQMGVVAFAVFGFPLATFWLAQRQYLDHARTSVESLEERRDELEATNDRLRSVLGDNQSLVRRIHESYLATITALARTIEAKDPYTGDHTERVATIAARIAEQLDFSESDRRAIGVGAVIHDIGKIGIPDAILLKPGKLSEEEFACMQRHPEISSYILADLELPGLVKEMVRSHHERFDGTGYPDGLAGERIPLAARVLCVADALDAMTSDRPYRAALPLKTALGEVRAQVGRQFCPKVVAALEASLEADPAAWRTLAGDGPGEIVAA